VRLRVHPDRCRPGHRGGPGAAHPFPGTLIRGGAATAEPARHPDFRC
jgi:hypothetical protein